ncbi:hypothetical protein MA16_Dca000626 [Dendrobium catenatum]|uniref:Uncharacterized protein n=1 Tax=Dendrobium catenatum TaxID=906689 RepID=A0A2I0WUF5_9ASPA|nr:hypothetical protein MA16_Dca000626 [Dendrobium catenatum]
MEVGRIIVNNRSQKDHSHKTTDKSLGVIRWFDKTLTYVSGPTKVRAPVSGTTKAQRNFSVLQWFGGTLVLGGGLAELRRRAVVRWKLASGVVRHNSGVKWWSSRTPASGGGQMELQHQVVVQQKSESQVVFLRKSGP